MRIGIIGAGISGLSAAWWLSAKGHDVSVFERAPDAGGLISTFDFDGVRIDHFYHFLCSQDHGYFDLCRELGLADRIRFVPAKTGFYYDGREWPFSNPVDLLRFTPLSFVDRMRLGLFILEARLREEWRQLDEIPAKPWLVDRIGQKAYDMVWHPLLALKFGADYDRISAAWVWHRLHRVAKSKGKMGYLEGGTQLLLDTLMAKLADRSVRVKCGKAVETIEAKDGAVCGIRFQDGEQFDCDRVISTLPLPALAGILPPGWDDFANRLRAVDYIGIVCVVLKLKGPLSKYFWYNVHDRRIPYNGVIEYTNLNALGGRHGHIVYVPYYVATDSPLYQKSDEELIELSWNALKTMAPHLTDADLIGRHVSRAAYGQAICPTGFLKALLDPSAPLRGLHLLDSTFLYPEDRSQSGLIVKARECAEAVGP